MLLFRWLLVSFVLWPIVWHFKIAAFAKPGNVSSYFIKSRSLPISHFAGLTFTILIFRATLKHFSRLVYMDFFGFRDFLKYLKHFFEFVYMDFCIKLSSKISTSKYFGWICKTKLFAWLLFRRLFRTTLKHFSRSVYMDFFGFRDLNFITFPGSTLKHFSRQAYMQNRQFLNDFFKN